MFVWDTVGVKILCYVVQYSQGMSRIRTRTNLPSFVFPSCPPQPVLWVSSSRAQRDSAQAVQASATPPSRGRQCVRVDLDTCVQNLMLPTPHARVSMQKTVLMHESTCKYGGAKQHKYLLACFHSLPSPAVRHFVFTISGAISLFLWCHLAKLLYSALCPLCHCWALRCMSFVTGCRGGRAFTPKWSRH